MKQIGIGGKERPTAQVRPAGARARTNGFDASRRRGATAGIDPDDRIAVVREFILCECCKVRTATILQLRDQPMDAKYASQPGRCDHRNLSRSDAAAPSPHHDITLVRAYQCENGRGSYRPATGAAMLIERNAGIIASRRSNEAKCRTTATPADPLDRIGQTRSPRDHLANAGIRHRPRKPQCLYRIGARPLTTPGCKTAGS